ncbi:MarR family winged helix-turn-helix transcriptional regulator [Propionispira raffinosivorans]|uniref:MarR family winged helix-turn-helix transcriptional regulator n=1 Tax=Propionispira raffinosivorans TaxID=86959 RepID=UPI0003697F6C|nr:MarR family transcriptional regulator [Propionispira raffinosivorans]
MLKKPYEQELGHYIQKSAHLITLISNERLEEIGLTLSQMRLLRCLWNRNALMQKQLQEELLIKASSVNGLVEQLLKKNLVQRQIHPVDARKVQICLTEQGRSLQQKSEALFADFEKTVSANLNVEEKRAMMQYLEGIFQKLLQLRNKN